MISGEVIDVVCGGCLHWKSSEGRFGLCTIRAPRRGANGLLGSPVTDRDDYCGEYVDKKDHEAEIRFAVYDNKMRRKVAESMYLELAEVDDSPCSSVDPSDATQTPNSYSAGGPAIASGSQMIHWST